MTQTKTSLHYLKGFLREDEIHAMQSKADIAYQQLVNKTGKGNDFLGWVDWTETFDMEIVRRIEHQAAILRKKSQAFVVIGIGGSYLGTRAVIEALANPFQLGNASLGNPQIIYAGHQLSEDYHAQLLNYLEDKEYSLAVISKSGTTTEPAVAFRMLKTHLEQKYGKAEAQTRIIAITDARKGALKKLADDEGYATYIVPDDVGGRYSVLTPVGLFPIAMAGFDIRKLLEGAKNMRTQLLKSSIVTENPAIEYAIIRNLLYQKGKTTEILVNYEPRLYYLTEWWKQLYGESEGKENKGIFPAGISLTTDLHSMGQYVQEGLRNLFETVLSVEQPVETLSIPNDPDNLDGLNFLTGKRLSEVNKMAELGTILAHTDGGVPNFRITIPQINETTLGELIYFFEFACGLSGYILGVNPFDQPGVEAYKKNMFALLGKPGFEKETEEIRKRI